MGNEMGGIATIQPPILDLPMIENRTYENEQAVPQPGVMVRNEHKLQCIDVYPQHIELANKE